MSGINWSLLQPVDYAGEFQKGWDRGSAQRREVDQHTTRSALLANPDDPVAVRNAMMADPNGTSALLRFIREQQGWKRDDQFRTAAGNYYGTVVNSLMPQPAGAAPEAANRAPVSATMAGTPSQPVAAPMAGGAQSAPTLPAPATGIGGVEAPTPNAQPNMADANGDGIADALAGIDRQTAAFRQMMAADPTKAFAAMKETYGLMKSRIDTAQAAYSTAYTQLAGATDEPSYQRVLASVQSQFAPLGVDITAVAPRNFPGPEGVRQLRMQALKAGDALLAADRKARLDWDIQDDVADNERADRNTDSMIENRESTMADRGARLSIARDRAARSGRGGGRRGGGSRPPSVGAIRGSILAKIQAGQPLTPGEQRAWDMSAARSSGSGRGNGNSGPKITRTATGPDNRKMGWNGKAWVPVK